MAVSVFVALAIVSILVLLEVVSPVAFAVAIAAGVVVTVYRLLEAVQSMSSA